MMESSSRDVDVGPLPPVLDQNSVNAERLAAKTSCASDLLKNVADIAQRLRKVEQGLNRYLYQARLLLVWKRGSGAVKMAGSAAKTVSTLMLVAAPFHHRLRLGLNVAHRLWKLGTGLKLVCAIGNLIKDVWQKGFRSSLLEFTQCAASLTRDLSTFGEVLRDLQAAAPAHCGTANSAFVLLNVIRDFIPAHQIPYATHVINMAFGNERYSPLFAFTSLTAHSQNNSNIAQIMLEIESFHFDEFIDNGSESGALVVIGSFIHVSKELFDFLDGFQHLTERDCQFLQQCLTRLSQESVEIMRAVSVLVSLDRIRQHLNEDNKQSVTSSTNNTHSLYDSHRANQGHNESASTSLDVSNSSHVFNSHRTVSLNTAMKREENSTCETSTETTYLTEVIEPSTDTTYLTEVIEPMVDPDATQANEEDIIDVQVVKTEVL